jgi:hypothetical protein
LKIIEKLSSVKREKLGKLNNEIKKLEINEWNGSEIDFSVLLHKIDLKNSIMPENENSDEICCSSGT